MGAYRPSDGNANVNLSPEKRVAWLNPCTRIASVHACALHCGAHPVQPTGAGQSGTSDSCARYAPDDALFQSSAFSYNQLARLGRDTHFTGQIGAALNFRWLAGRVATVIFRVPQALAEVVERGLDRRASEGLDVDDMPSVCTFMLGRLDDWTHVLAKRDGIIVNPGYMHWAGVAAFKRAYSIYQERGYRQHLHWSELIGGDIILTTPYKWQVWFNNSNVEVKERIHHPVDEEIIDDLYEHFPDFRRAYEPDELTVEEYDTYRTTQRTLRGFIGSYHDFRATVRDFMLPIGCEVAGLLSSVFSNPAHYQAT